jgi:DNA-binding Xre family transcriptional regulator
VTVKTLHGAFSFSVQRLGCGPEATTWLEQTGQVQPGYVSEGLAEFSGYYSNRMSYEEVAGLIERVTGQRLLSDQAIQQLVVAKAVEVSQHWADQLSGEAAADVRAAESVEWYEAQAEEVLVLADAICVKQQKPLRGEARDRPSVERPTKRVNTDVWMVETTSGDFSYVTAGIDTMGQEVVSAVDQVRQQVRHQYGGRTDPLPVVAITDGAKSIRCDLETIFGRAVPLILDWYHLEKKVWELMSMIVRKKGEKEQHVQHLLAQLWAGHTEAALEYLRTAVVTNRAEKLEALCTYLEKHQTEIIDYERRQRAGKPIGSGRMEKGVDQVIGLRQKKKGMSWSPAGSKALGILKVVELNDQWQSLWFPHQVAA